MADQPKAIVFDTDAASLATLRQAFPEWAIQVMNGTGSLARDGDAETVGLVLVGVRERVEETWSLCRTLRRRVGRTPLVVLVPVGNDELVRLALAAGAHCCLALPVHAKDLVSTVARVQQGNQPGRHTLNLDRAQREDRWRDEGGEA